MSKLVTTQVKIDKKVPFEPYRKLQAPFEALEVGDSFFIVKGDRGIAASVLYYSKKLNRRFSMRTREEDGIEGVRVWRTE